MRWLLSQLDPSGCPSRSGEDARLESSFPVVLLAGSRRPDLHAPPPFSAREADARSATQTMRLVHRCIALHSCWISAHAISTALSGATQGGTTMSQKRNVPTNLLTHPDVVERAHETVRVILPGLLRDAENEGRGYPHPSLLARRLEKRLEEMKPALAEREAHSIVRCSFVADRRSAALCYWHPAEGEKKPTFFAPLPAGKERASRTSAQDHPERDRPSPASAGKAVPEAEGTRRRPEDEAKNPPGAEDLPPASHRSVRSNASAPLEKTRAERGPRGCTTTESAARLQEAWTPPSLLRVKATRNARFWITDARRHRVGRSIFPHGLRRPQGMLPWAGA